MHDCVDNIVRVSHSSTMAGLSGMHASLKEHTGKEPESGDITATGATVTRHSSDANKKQPVMVE